MNYEKTVEFSKSNDIAESQQQVAQPASMMQNKSLEEKEARVEAFEQPDKAPDTFAKNSMDFRDKITPISSAKMYSED